MTRRGYTAGMVAIVGLLLTAMSFAGMLTWAAVRAERARRDALRQAIRGYALFVADDVVHRSVFEFEQLTSLPLRRATLAYLDAHDTLPALEALGTNDQLRRAVAVTDRLFLVDTAAQSVTPSVPEPLRTWLVSTFPQIVAARAHELPTLRVRLADGEHLLIYGTGQLDRHRIFGAVMKPGAVGVIAAHAFERRSAFPPMLGGGPVSNNSVFIRLLRHGREEFSTADRHFERSIQATMPVPLSYGVALGGSTIECAIDPSAVPQLIVGGALPSRVPLLIAALLSSTAALVAAFFILWRERQLAALRSDFVSGVSHELRTPLTQIRMFSETLLLNRVRSEDERRHSLHVIAEEARRLSNLVDNVLFFSRDRSEPFQAVRSLCDVDGVITEAIDAFAPLAIRNDVAITTNMSPPLRAAIDAEAWKQVVTNILDNAVKYGPAGQTIRVEAVAFNGTLRMSIDDEGPGIPADERENVWKRYHRLSRDRETYKTGSGLGLAIVREIVSAHGGTCRIEDAPGRGARFVVEVPA